MTENNFLQSLYMKNFRSWQEGLIEFSPKVNIIIGENDNGKSNILRALNLVFNNSPIGDSYRSNWGGDTEVGVKIDDKTVSRIKTDKDNYYTFNNQEFRSFNKGVPEEIKKFLNFSDINIAFQLDGPFLLNKSPADVARYYNEVVNLDIIDRSIKNIRTTLTDEKSQKDKIKSDIDKKEKELQELSWLDNVEEKINELEAKELLIKRKHNEFSLLSELLYKLKEYETELQEVEKITVFEDQVKKLETLSVDIYRLQLDFQDLNNFITKIKGFGWDLFNLNKKITFEKTVNKLVDQNNKIIVFDKEYEEFRKLLMDLKLLKHDEEYYDQRICFEEQVNKLCILDNKIILATLDNDNLLKDYKNLKYFNEEETKLSKIIQYESQINSLFEKKSNIKIKTEEYNNLLDYIEAINEIDIQITHTEWDINRLQKQYSEEIPNLCPILQIECSSLQEIKSGR